MSNLRFKKYSKKPKFMITYFCNNCGFDFAMSELDKPKCFYCGGICDHKIIKKEKITKKVIFNRLKLVNERMMENLRKAYDVRPEELNDEDMDQLMLEALAKGKSLGDMIEKIHKNKKD
jgi:DNA-directed RNA polymerase subunit RPC12/RpoP